MAAQPSAFSISNSWLSSWTTYFIFAGRAVCISAHWCEQPVHFSQKDEAFRIENSQQKLLLYITARMKNLDHSQFRSLIHHEKKTFCGSKGSSQTPWLASWGRSPKTIKDIRQRETELYGSWGTYGVALKWCLCSYSTHWTGSFLRITIRRQLVLQLNYASDDTDVNIKIVMVPLCDCGRILCGPLAAYIVYKSVTITGWISEDSW